MKTAEMKRLTLSRTLCGFVKEIYGAEVVQICHTHATLLVITRWTAVTIKKGRAKTIYCFLNVLFFFLMLMYDVQ